jgi:hypothetical protein
MEDRLPATTRCRLSGGLTWGVNAGSAEAAPGFVD